MLDELRHQPVPKQPLQALGRLISQLYVRFSTTIASSLQIAASLTHRKQTACWAAGRLCGPPKGVLRLDDRYGGILVELRATLLTSAGGAVRFHATTDGVQPSLFISALVQNLGEIIFARIEYA